MFFFSQSGDDRGEIAFSGLRNDVGGTRPVAAHAHIEWPVETKRESPRRVIKLHRGNAEIEHDAVKAARATRDRLQVGEAVLEQRKPAVHLLGERCALGDGSVVAIDRNHVRVCSLQNRPRITAGAEGRVEIKTTGFDREPFDGVAGEHGNVTSRSASDSIAVAARCHSRAPSGFAAATRVPSSCLKARTFSVASASSARKRLGSQIRNLWPRPTKLAASVMPACAFRPSVKTTWPSPSIFRVSLVP